MKYVNRENESKTANKSELTNFKRILIIGVAVVLSLAVISVNEKEEYVTVSAGVSHGEQDDTSAEPFGYLNGEWNLWEYIGDTVSSLIGIS